MNKIWLGKWLTEEVSSDGAGLGGTGDAEKGISGTVIESETGV
jgi:hypothetical protein